MRPIDADALKEAITQNREIERNAVCDVLDIIDNAPTVEITEEQAIDKLHETGWLPRHDKEMTERPTEVNCSHCDYFKFSKSFIENVVGIMLKYNIETVDDLMTELNRINELWGGRR